MVYHFESNEFRERHCGEQKKKKKWLGRKKSVQIVPRRLVYERQKPIKCAYYKLGNNLKGDKILFRKIEFLNYSRLRFFNKIIAFE